MKLEKILIATAVSSIFIFIFGMVIYPWMADPVTEIKQGFSQYTLDALKSDYGITIPKNALFIKGLNSNTFRDSSVDILFECPIDDSLNTDDMHAVCDWVYDILELDKNMYIGGLGSDEKISADWYEEMGGELDHCIKTKRDDLTKISYSATEEKIIIRIHGYAPKYSYK